MTTFAEECARRARVVARSLEKRKWTVRWWTVRASIKEYWLDMTYKGRKKTAVKVDTICAEPNCSELPTAIGANGKWYCTGHIHKGGQRKNVVIT